MITFPCAKINLGLNVVSKREDGYHNLETVFYPIPLCDALEIRTMHQDFPSESPCDIKVTYSPSLETPADWREMEGESNLVVKAYRLLAADFKLPRVHVHLYKRIPSQAGLGGGSSDAASMIRLLDERYRLNIGNAEMERYAARLGADCPFFITSEPAFATGVGDILVPADSPRGNLHGYWLTVVKPPIAISTREAYQAITPNKPGKCCRDIVREPIDTWREQLTNDFEGALFERYPQLSQIKDKLYELGAVYAQMSGSGSALFGIFKGHPDLSIVNSFPSAIVETMKL